MGDADCNVYVTKDCILTLLKLLEIVKRKTDGPVWK